MSGSRNAHSHRAISAYGAIDERHVAQSLLCGSIHTVDENIDFNMYQALGTMNGAETGATVN